MISFFQSVISDLDIEITEEQFQKFQIFYDLLIEKNKVMNLTAITEMEDVVIKHFLDSIMIVSHFDFSSKKIIDVGTGAGFPGIPLAIMMPNAQFLLLDSLNKRILFLEEVIQACGLTNVTLLHSRAEDGSLDSNYREQFDFCVSRAVANMSTLLEYCSPYVKVGGKFVSYKSGDIQEELKNSSNAQKLLNCKNSEVISFTLHHPSEIINRSFVIFDKTGHTLKKYPRQAGKAKRNPL